VPGAEERLKKRSSRSDAFNATEEITSTQIAEDTSMRKSLFVTLTAAGILALADCFSWAEEGVSLLISLFALE
jgi:hypothetical protein